MASQRNKADQLARRDILRQHLGFNRESCLQLCDRSHNRWSRIQLAEINPDLERRYPGFSDAIKHLAASPESNLSIQNFSKHHIKLLLDDKPEISNYFELVNVCFFSARAGARVLITETDDDSFIEFSAGAVFRAEQIGSDLERVERAIAVDGHIDSVSEIDKLLTAALDAKQSLILCRSVSKEIELTVKKNSDRMKLAIMIFNITDETVNDLGDACSALEIPLHDSVSIT